MDENSLIRRAKEHDQEAITQLYEDNFNRIYRYVLVKTGDRMEAEDITQQVFLKAIQSISGFKIKGVPFSAWLYRIAHNQIVDYYRKKAKRVSVPLEENITSGKDDPTREVERIMDAESLSQAMMKLTKLQQEVLSLRFTGEMPIAQVARIMGKSEGAIKALQHSAILSLRKIMLAEYSNV